MNKCAYVKTNARILKSSLLNGLKVLFGIFRSFLFYYIPVLPRRYGRFLSKYAVNIKKMYWSQPKKFHFDIDKMPNRVYNTATKKI